MFTTTATNLPRIMTCNGSRLMGEAEAPLNGDDTVRNEGIAAHWLVKQVHGGRFEAVELVDRKSENGIYIEPEMVEYLEDYLRDIHECEIEINTDVSGQEWQINGRVDKLKHVETHGLLVVSDLKYGWRIVEPEMNWTLISHAMSWILKNPDKVVQHVTFQIYQPRAYHPEGRVRSWTVSRAEADALFNEINVTLSNLTDTLQTSPNCVYCPGYTTCPAARKAENNCIDASHKAFTDKLTNEELAARLNELQRAEEVLKQSNKAFKEEALHRLKQGQIIADYACDTELTNRQFKKDVTPEFIEMMTGIDATNKKLMTPAQVEKAGVPKEFVATLTERRTKGVKLVRISADKKAKKLLNIKGK